jgi:hypothetical protein
MQFDAGLKITGYLMVVLSLCFLISFHLSHFSFFLFDKYFEGDNEAKEPPSPKAAFGQQYFTRILFLYENECQYFNNMYLHGVR